MEIESSLKTKWQRIKCKINALLGFYRKTIHIIYLLIIRLCTCYIRNY